MIDSTGYIAETQAEIETRIKAKFAAAFGAGLDLSSDQPMGQIVSIFSEALAQEQEARQQIFAQLDKDQAEGVFLKAIVAQQGVSTLPARRSLVDVQMTLNANTTVNAGALVNVTGDPTRTFRLITAVTSTTAGNYTGKFESVDLGPIAAPALSLTTITNPVTGWTFATNPVAATLGRNVETDAELRDRSDAERTAPGGSTLVSIVPDLLAWMRSKNFLRGEVAVVENDTLIDKPSPASSATLKAKSFEVLIYDDNTFTNAEIAAQIWRSKPSCSTTSGVQTANVIVTEEGIQNTYPVRFTRALDFPQAMQFTLEVTADFGAAESLALKEFIVKEFAKNQRLGVPVNYTRYKASPFNSGIRGIVNVVSFEINGDILNVPVPLGQKASIAVASILINQVTV